MANGFHDAIDIAEHVVVPEAEHAVALRFQECGSCLIITNRLPMLAAINLDHQPHRSRDKVADEGPDHDLTVEPDAAELAIADHTPKLSLGRRGVVSQFTGSLRGEGVIGFLC